LFAAGRRSYTGGGVCWIGVGAPPRGEAVEAGSILVGQPLFAAGRRSYRGRVVCWVGVGAPPRGEAVEAGSILVVQPLFAAGRRSYAGGGVCWVGVGAPPRGQALGLRSGLWDSRHCSRRGAAPTGGRVVCWVGVGALPRGEAVEADSILVGQPLFAAGRRSYRGARRLLGWRRSPASGRSFGVALGIAG
jgi:ribosomal protein L27